MMSSGMKSEAEEDEGYGSNLSKMFMNYLSKTAAN